MIHENEIEQTEVMYFVHHFSTHSIVWEVWETSYGNIFDVPKNLRGVMVEGADGKIYNVQYPDMMTRERAEDYVTVADNEFSRYVVTEISHERPDTPVTFACVSYYRSDRVSESYGTFDTLTLRLMQDAEPEYRNPVLAWAKDAVSGSDFTMMNGAVKEIWSAQ